MAGKKNVMATIKRAISPLRPRHTVDDSVGSSVTAEHTPLTRYVMNKLTGPSKELFALSFAVQMKVDKHALVFDLADCLPWIGISRIDNAVRLLTRHFTEGQYRVETVFLPKEENLDRGGRRPKRHWISLDILEDLMMQADTEQGRKARTMYKQLRDAVQEYMQIEMAAAASIATEEKRQVQQQLEEQTSRLALKEQRLRELDDVLQTERSQRERMAAQREADDEPRQTLYLYRSRQFIKIGETETDAKKRGKALQTGNPEDLELILEAKCIDSKRIEASLHHIFRWHRRRGEWFDVPAETATYFARLVISILDGARKIDFQEISADEACRELLEDLRFTPNCAINDTAHRNHETSEAQSEKPDLRDPYTRYIDEGLDITLSGNDRLLKRAVEEDCEGWFKRFRSVDCIFDKGDLEDALTERHVIKKISTRIPGHPGTPQGYVGVRFRPPDVE